MGELRLITNCIDRRCNSGQFIDRWPRSTKVVERASEPPFVVRIGNEDPSPIEQHCSGIHSVIFAEPL
jgi:hypothetical protein